LTAITSVACEGRSDEAATGTGSRPATTSPGTTTDHEGSVATRDETADVFGRIPEIVRVVQPSVVAVLTDVGQGSGVVWSEDGIVVTNQHVVAGSTEVAVAFADGRRAPATIVASDALTDLAVVRAERTALPPIHIAEGLPEVGELAVAIGTPLGLENTVTAGIVSGLQRSLPNAASLSPALIDLIQTDAAISPGNSGGALVNGDGQLIGINVAHIPPEARAVSIGFAIPAPTVVDTVEELLEDGTASHAYLGVVPTQLTPEIAAQLGTEVDAGVVVTEVVPGSPAAESGVQPGDLVIEMDGQEVPTVERLLAILRSLEPGDRLEVAVQRRDETQTVQVTLDEREGP
jgi:serine protease DegQ